MKLKELPNLHYFNAGAMCANSCPDSRRALEVTADKEAVPAGWPEQQVRDMEKAAAEYGTIFMWEAGKLADEELQYAHFAEPFRTSLYRWLDTYY